MIRHSFSVALILALVGLALIPSWQSARACQCPQIEPDAAYEQAFLVFTGKVDKVTDLTREVVHEGKPIQSFDGRIAHFTVEEYFKGGGAPEIELRSGNTPCETYFDAGKRYVVYASQDTQTGAVGPFSCSRTQPLSDYAKPDLSYLPRAKRGERPTMLYGFAYKSTDNSNREPERLGDLKVTVEGEGKKLELKTDKSGYFETFDLPAGSYHVRTGVTGKLRGAEEKAVELKSGSVASMVFSTTTMGSLNGRVIDQEGQPVGQITVELSIPGATPAPTGVPNYQPTSTGEDGRFTFEEVAAGRYVLAVNPRGGRSLSASQFSPSYYPNASTSAETKVITVTDGVAVGLDDFVLQKRYPTVAVSGMVVTADGKPVAGAYVYLKEHGGGWDGAKWPARTDADGRFVHEAYEGVTYSLSADADGPTGGAVESDRVEVVAGKPAAPVRIVVKIPK